MEQYLGTAIIYFGAGLVVLGIVWGGIRLGRKSRKVNPGQDSTGASYEQISSTVKGEIEPEAKKEEVVLGKGSVKCICFRRIKGNNVVDFTTIEEAIGETYQVDPSCPVSGSSSIVKEDAGKIVDYDPREVKFTVETSPERAWFAIHWDIVRAVFFVPVQFWKSVSVWFAAAMLVIVFVSALAVLG